MGIQSVIRFLLPREDHFYDFLERQAVVAHKGAHALRSFKDGDVARVPDAVQLLEHEGDKIVHETEEALAKSFVTPIDREDLQKLPGRTRWRRPATSSCCRSRPPSAASTTGDRPTQRRTAGRPCSATSMPARRPRRPARLVSDGPAHGGGKGAGVPALRTGAVRVPDDGAAPMTFAEA